MTYSSLADEIFRSGSLTGIGSTTGVFIDAMRSNPVFPEYLHWYRSGDAECLTFVLSFLWFGKKAELVDPDLEPDALRKWLTVEERLKTVYLDPTITQDLRYLARILLPVIYDLPFLGKHGPGSVAGGGRSIKIKLKKIRFDPLLDSVYFGASHTAWQRKIAHSPEQVIPNGKRWTADRERLVTAHVRESAELMFVPKTISAMRSICREPAVIMYFQQALRYELEECIKSGPLRRFIELRDQALNQKACAFGSYTGMIDTLDLTAASDSVPWALVKTVFPAWMVKKMYATRSKTVKLPSGEIVAIHKFAPMGSAVCFPTQCIIYTLVGIREYLLKLVGPRWKSVVRDVPSFEEFWDRHVYRDPYPGINMLQPLRVFGDDILCDEHITEDVIHVLTSLGFQVNVEKSFTGNVASRESCGSYYWNGEDVTPIRFKLPHFTSSATMRCVGSLVDFANRAGDYGYRNLQRCLIHKVLGIPIEGYHKRAGTRNPIRFVGLRSEFGLYTNRPEDERNRHLRRRDFKKELIGTSTASYISYQRDEVRCIQLRIPVTKDESPIRNEGNYIEWWRAAYHRGDSTETESPASWYDAVQRGCDVGWGWNPA